MNAKPDSHNIKCLRVYCSDSGDGASSDIQIITCSVD